MFGSILFHSLTSVIDRKDLYKFFFVIIGCSSTRQQLLILKLVKYGHFCPKWHFQETEAATRGVLCKKVFLRISQISQENTCARVSFFKKVAGLRPVTLLKKRLWHRFFPENFGKFVGTPFLQNTSGRLLLKKPSSIFL